VKIVKVSQAYHIYKELLIQYAVEQLMEHIRRHRIGSLEKLIDSLPPRLTIASWVNVGGQLILRSELEKQLRLIRSGRVKSWDDMHGFYAEQAKIILPTNSPMHLPF
jgi:hypothetical protein